MEFIHKAEAAALEKPHRVVLSPTRVLLGIAAGSPAQRYHTFKGCISSLRRTASQYRKDGIGVWSIRAEHETVYVKRIT
ncbi:MAG: hypothetical protein IKO26_07935 [Paludibacteraceae bacterium]|nr:hypothetical protein [Paludibacteraceae bacterium]